MNLAEALIAVLEKGIVIVLKLDGTPGDRHLRVGIGTADSSDALFMALGVAYLGRGEPDFWNS